MNPELVTGFECIATRMRTTVAASPEALAHTYGPGKWTARQMLFHIIDVEGVFCDRLKRSVADAKPLYWAIDPDRWTARLAYPERSLAIAAGLFFAQHSALLEFLKSVTSAEWDRAGVHSDVGRLTVGDLATKVVWHAAHHLDQVEAAVAGRTWTPSA